MCCMCHMGCLLIICVPALYEYGLLGIGMAAKWAGLQIDQDAARVCCIFADSQPMHNHHCVFMFSTFAAAPMHPPPFSAPGAAPAQGGAHDQR